MDVGMRCQGETSGDEMKRVPPLPRHGSIEAAHSSGVTVSDGERRAAAEYDCRRDQDLSAHTIPGLAEGDACFRFDDQANPGFAPCGAGRCRGRDLAGWNPPGRPPPGRRGDPGWPRLHRVRAGGDETRAVLSIHLRVRCRVGGPVDFRQGSDVRGSVGRRRV